MRQVILTELNRIAEKEQVEVIYACEVGSRLWGYATSESDYDVKFIYAHPVKRYLSVDQPRAVIELNTSPNLEFCGWDLYKVMTLFHKSNPSLYEWLFSTQIYVNKGTFAAELTALMRQHYSLKKLAFHYLNLARGNDKKQNRTRKTELHLMRGLQAADWIVTHHTFPPLQVSQVKHVNIEQQLLELEAKIANMEEEPLVQTERLNQVIWKQLNMEE